LHGRDSRFGLSRSADKSYESKPIRLNQGKRDRPPMGGGAAGKKKVPHKSKSGLFHSNKNKQPRRSMEQNNDGRTKRQWKHYNWEERIRLETLCRTLYPGKKEPNFAELGRRLDRHRSSVSREYHRGKVINKNSELEAFFVYSARRGQDKANLLSSAKGPTGKLTNHIAKDISDLIIKQKLSPYAALVCLAKRGKYVWLPCERSVYYAIDEGLLEVSREQLPYKPRKRKQKKSGTRMAYNNPHGKSINMRPQEANDRSEYGHWEMDTVVGGKGSKPPKGNFASRSFAKSLRKPRRRLSGP